MVEVEDAQDIAISFVKDKRNVEDVRVVITEQKDGVWIVIGTCPINLCGHPWRENFEIKINQKGKITASSFKLM
ncbi:hypothetical protein KAU88_09200 [Candidatus Bathyarchaeota archaeon]|nr:hypothetical protein [Candidatus Bathyarchaeota archaeon]